MKRIAIFTSGEGSCAVRLVPLFNEGDSFRIDLVVTDRSDSRLIEQMIQKGVNALFLPRSVWQVNPDEVIKLLDDNNIDILALDDFQGELPEKISEMYAGRIVRLTSPEAAPGEIERVGIHGETESVAAPKIPEIPKSVDEEWAETLKIKFDPAQISQTPPPIPVVTPQQPYAPQNPSMAGRHPSSPSGQSYNGVSQGYNPSGTQAPMPPNYLIWSILTTVLCCTIPGIVAIIFSSQVTSKYYRGDIEGAKRASRNAEIWIIVSFVLGVLSSTLYLPIMLAANA